MSNSMPSEALMVAEIDPQADQFLRLGYVLDLTDGTDAYIELLEVLRQYIRLDGSGLNRRQRIPLRAV